MAISDAQWERLVVAFEGIAKALAGGKPAAAPAASGPVFPPYGRSKGAPVKGATKEDLEYYATGCQRTLDDPSKDRWHEKERALLAAIRAEQQAHRTSLRQTWREFGG